MNNFVIYNKKKKKKKNSEKVAFELHPVFINNNRTLCVVDVYELIPAFNDEFDWLRRNLQTRSWDYAFQEHINLI